MTNRPDLDALWNFDAPGESENVFRGLLSQANNDLAYELELLTQIARAQGLQKKFDEGHATLDDVESRITDEMMRARVRLLLERGRLFNSAGEKDKARPLFEQAWELGREADELELAFDAGHMIAIVEAPEVEWSLKVIDAAETSHDERVQPWLARLYNNVGWTYHERGEYDTALVYFERALRQFEQEGDPVRVRRARWAVARTLRSLDRVNDAHAVQWQLQQEGEDDGLVEEELGECLLALGREDEAKPHFVRAYNILSKDEWLVENERERIERLRELSQSS